MTVPTLRTDRLVLRAFRQQDEALLATTINDYEISKWLTVVPYPYTIEDAAWFIGENLAGRFHTWAIWRGDNLAGAMGLDKELGYWLAQDFRGQGYATEAATAIVAHHFATTDAKLICSSHFVENDPSRNVLEKLGFVDVGAHVHHSKARGADIPGRSMELTRARWDSLQDG
ncbi:MAG: GNAT family N-acetyltransferase [Pseudomonadota bacterium]